MGCLCSCRLLLSLFGEINTLLLHLCLTITPHRFVHVVRLFPHTHCITNPRQADTQQPCASGASVSLVSVLLVSDWCVRTDKDLSSVNTFFSSIFVGDTQAQEDVGVYLPQPLQWTSRNNFTKNTSKHLEFIIIEYHKNRQKLCVNIFLHCLQTSRFKNKKQRKVCCCL